MERKIGEVFKFRDRWLMVAPCMNGNVTCCDGCYLNRPDIHCGEHTDVIGFCQGKNGDFIYRDITEKMLHLSVTYKWYNKIVIEDKDEEYREFKHYWFRLIGKNYSHVLIRRGYTKEFVIYPIDKIYIGKGKPEWGAPDKNCIIIKLNKNNVWKGK